MYITMITIASSYMMILSLYQRQFFIHIISHIPYTVYVRLYAKNHTFIMLTYCTPLSYTLYTITFTYMSHTTLHPLQGFTQDFFIGGHDKN